MTMSEQPSPQPGRVMPCVLCNSAENVEHARGGMYYCRACAVEFDAIVFDLSKPDSPLPKGHPDHRDDWR